MAGTLLSGPAGAGKSQTAAGLVAAAERPTVLADFTSIAVAMLAHTRGPDGRYPVRPTWVLPLAEYVRRTIIRAAVARDIDVVATNSDGAPDRRAELLALLEEPAAVRVIDPGREVVEGRLRDPVTDELSAECQRAVGRWYDRLG